MGALLVNKLIEFAYYNSNSYQASMGMAPYEADYGYGRRCRTAVCWYEVGEMELTGAQLVDQTIRVVRENLQAAQSLQKSYADSKRRPLEFDATSKFRPSRASADKASSPLSYV